MIFSSCCQHLVQGDHVKAVYGLACNILSDAAATGDVLHDPLNRGLNMEQFSQLYDYR